MTLDTLLTTLSAIKDIPPWFATATSLAALFVSTLNYRRDRPILVATSNFYHGDEYGPASIGIRIVNAGRRPIIITAWKSAETTRTRWGRRKVVAAVGSYFESSDGLTLGERQTHKFTVEAINLINSIGDGDIFEVDDIWIEDTLGHKHKVKNVRENIKKLSDWKWPKPKNGQ